jgi:DNA-binding response OmpR family regulator
VDLGQMTSKEKLAKELPRGVFDCLVAEEIELVTKFALFLLQQRHSAGDRPVSNGREHHVLTRGKGQLQIFDDRCLVLCRGRSVRLAPKAHRMLLLLAQSDTTVSHDFLRQTLWPGLAATSRALPVHVCNLRRELEIDPNDPKLILTNHGQGYYLER